MSEEKEVPMPEESPVEEVQADPVKEPKKRSGVWLYNVAIVVCILVFSVSAFFLGQWLYENYKTSQLTDQLQSIAGVSESTVEEEGVEVIPPVEEEEPVLLSDMSFAQLMTENPDTVGWIRVAGTNVNYPIVQTGDNDYYLKRDYYHNWTNAGWIYGDYRCNFDDIRANKNLIIYGHGRLDMSMFGSLEYCRRAWWLNNPGYHTVQISTPTETTVWKVFAVYTTSVDFYYIKTAFNYEGELTRLVDEMKAKSIKDFGVTVEDDDTILTLSTCTTDADRLVVNAVLVSTQPTVQEPTVTPPTE